MRTLLSRISHHFEAIPKDTQQYLSENSTLVIILSIIMLAGYGFELFNLNLTIDEEVFSLSPNFAQWISRGRWGMYLLHKYILPQPVIPFVPLFIALVFHLAAILIVVRCWGIVSTTEGLIVGAMGASFSGMAFVYTFSTINYAVGIALFLISISLLIYKRATGLKQFYAAIPAGLAISVYQTLLLAFASAFLIYYIATIIRTERRRIDFQELFRMVGVGLLALLLYFSLQQLFVTIIGSDDDYIAGLVDFRYLLEAPQIVLANIASAIVSVYSGADSMYGMRILLFGVLLGVGAIGIAANIMRSRVTVQGKIMLGFLGVALMLIPFGFALFTRGLLFNRSLIALPIALSGWLAISLLGSPRPYKLLIGLLAAVSTFQFIVSSNLLFSSSRLSLEADRLLAAEIVSRIDRVKSETGAGEVKFLEVIGYFERPETSITPKIETFGASFFEWDQGNVYRIVYFLNILGYKDLQAMPPDKRGKFIQIGNAMLAWPDIGSIMRVDDTILLKFGPYSYNQVRQICGTRNIPEFCEGID